MKFRWGFARLCTAIAVAAVCLTAPAGASAASVDVTVSLGGLLPIGTPNCSLCVNFVSTYDAVGPTGPVTRMHRNLAPNAPYALDVDGSLPPIPAGIVPLPGYELSATVQAISAEKPTIRLNKYSTAPPTLPLRMEIVTGDVSNDAAGKTTFGYDTLDSTAPASFVAALDVTDRDANPTTVNAFADMTIDTAARRLTVVTEGFTGPADRTRVNRNIRRLTYRGDPLKSTVVPRRASVDVTAGNTNLKAILTRDLRTTLDVDLTEPLGGPHTTGTLDELPTSTTLTLADEDVNADGDLDKKITYSAAAIVKRADLRIDEGGTSSRAGVDDLPSNATLTYALKDQGTDATADDSTHVTYHANSRATHAELRREDGPKVLTASLDNVAANIDDLSWIPAANGGHVVFHTDGRADKGEVEVIDGLKRTKATLLKLPEDMDLTWTSTAGESHAHYLADGVADEATVALVDEKDQKTNVKLEKFPSDVHLDYVKSASNGKVDFDYSANSDVPLAEIHGTDQKELPKKANAFHVVLKRVPKKMGFDLLKRTTSSSVQNELPPPEFCEHIAHPEDDPHCPQSEDYIGPPHETVTTTKTDEDLSVSTPNPGERLGSAEIQVTTGQDERLPATAEKGNLQDGVMLQDFPNDDKFVAFARLSEFDELTFKKHNEGTKTTGPGLPKPSSSSSTLDASLDTNAEDHALAIDTDTQADSGAVSSLDALLITLPKHVELHGKKSSTLGEDTLTWGASRTVDGWTTSSVDGQRRPGFDFIERSQQPNQSPVITKRAALDPMPTEFSACKHNLWICSEERFNDNITRLDNGNISNYRTFACLLDGCSGFGFPFNTQDARNGSFQLKSAQPTTFSYVDGDWFNKNDSYTDVQFRNLRRYGLQGHKREFSCVFDQVTCKTGYVAMDTENLPLGGRIEQKTEDSFTYLNFPDGFTADRLVWGFYKNNVLSGRVATIGGLDCPDGTQVKVGGETLNERFCNGDLLEGNILDQF